MATIRKVSKKYQVQVRMSGVCQTKSFATEEEARLWAWRMEAPLKQRKTAPDTPQTMGEVIALYESLILPTHRSGALEKNILLHLKGHWLCRIRCDQLSVSVLAKYRDERLKKVKPNTVKRVFNMLRPMIDIARDEWGCSFPSSNPARELKIRTEDDSRTKRLTPMEMETLMHEVYQIQNKEVIRVIEFAIETSMRRSEILSLQWKNVDLINRIATLELTKNGSTRQVALTSKAIKILGTEKTGQVFNCSANAIRCAFTRATQRAGIENYCFHQLRHEAISRMWEMGLNEAEISNQSGHKDWKMLRRYSHVRAVNLADKLKAREE